MKKFAKVSLITAGILFITGAVILIICSFFAGSMRGTISDAVSDRLHSTVSGNILHLWNWNGNSHHHFNDSYPIHNGQHTDDNAANAADIDELHIDLNYTNFTLAPSQDDYFHISSEGNGKYQYYTDGAAFYIDGFYNYSTSSINRLTLQVPDSDFSYIEINFGAGAATLSSLKSDSLTMCIGAGELTLDDVHCDKLSADIGAGTATIKSGQTGDADLNIGMGTLIYKGYINENLNAEVGMGDITLQLWDSQDNHNYDLECNMGTITLGSKEYGGIAFETEIDNGVDSDYTLECDMGSINITFENINQH
ncbi:MAG: DUF4097 domain-containing protein [Lachnospiraceae bacterium]|nr:DUF4097 domain-containing protein [Lachnospiraceae bacterium]